MWPFMMWVQAASWPNLTLVFPHSELKTASPLPTLLVLGLLSVRFQLYRMFSSILPWPNSYLPLRITQPSSLLRKPPAPLCSRTSYLLVPCYLSSLRFSFLLITQIRVQLPKRWAILLAA